MTKEMTWDEAKIVVDKYEGWMRWLDKYSLVAWIESKVDGDWIRWFYKV